ncbi:hypothetical protein JOY44_30210 (plasmid) [Phormidium sp. CLA17]|nr:hypothetical protein [Leptolyngbya sp. Cla-17]
MDLHLGRKIQTDKVPRVGLYPSQEIFIYEQGFLIIQPRFLRSDKVIAYRYEDIISIKILCGSSASYVLGNPVDFSYLLRYRYFTKNGSGNKYGDYDREEDFSSLSRKLVKAIRTNTEPKLWAKIKSDIQDGKEFIFGRFVVHKDYLRIADKKLDVPMIKIKEVKFHLSSEDDAFQIEFKPEFKKDFLWVATCVYIQHVDNPFLFIEALKMLKISVNLSDEIQNLDID